MNNRVLLVDDEVNILLAYRRNLKNFFDVTVADNGLSALEIIKSEEQFAVVVSDFRMPEMDGIEFLNKVKEISPDTVRIILTGFADLQIAIDAINEGSIYRFLTKPIQKEKLINIIQDSIQQYRLVTNEKELNRKLAEAYRTIKQDLETAAELQHYFLPENHKEISGAKFDWLFLPSVYVSGDTFNYFPINNHISAFYIVDVAGHGLPAALLSVSLSRTIEPSFSNPNIFISTDNSEDYLNFLTKPSLIVKELNQRFLSKGNNAEYFTMIYGIIDSKNNKLRFCQAGHPNPILIQNKTKVDLIGTNGFPVGILPEADYIDQEIDFMPGDKLLLYTDGVTECAGIKHKNSIQFRLIEFIQQFNNINSNDLITTIVEEIKLWGEIQEFPDDITMLIMERL